MELGFWKNIKKPIMALAPMSGITDEAFRLMFLKYGRPDVFFTEFVSAEGLFSRGQKHCLSVLKYAPEEKPIVAQIFGGSPEQFEKAARLVSELGFDGIDINMGCPDRDIEKQGGGSALIKDPQLAKKIIRAAKKGADKMPVSVKTRIGYEKNQILEWIPAILEEKPAVLTVHFRTKKEMYSGSAHWELAEEVIKLRNKISPETLILGNGDVKSLEQAKQLAKEKELDGIMIGRAALGNLWFFSGKEPTPLERIKATQEHAELFEKLFKEEDGSGCSKHFDSIKKHFHAYIKNFKGAKDLRENLMQVKNTPEAKSAIKKFLEDDLFEKEEVVNI